MTWKYAHYENWFQLDHYARCPSLQFKEWYLLFLARRRLFDYYYHGTDEPDYTQAFIEAYFDLLLLDNPFRMLDEYHTDDPKNKNDPVTFRLNEFSLNKPKNKQYSALYKSSVHPLSLRDAYGFYLDFKGRYHRIKPFIRYDDLFSLSVSEGLYASFQCPILTIETINHQVILQMISSDHDIVFDEFDRPESDPYCFYSSDSGHQRFTKDGIFLKINPDAPDDVLIHDFKQHLRAYRTLTHQAADQQPKPTTAHPNKKIKHPATTAKDMADWASFQLLAYMDLYLWHEHMKTYDKHFKPFSYAQFDALLFPDSTISDRVRRTVHPKTIRLFAQFDKYTAEFISLL